MRKILFILLLAPFALKSQTVNTFRDSTWFKRGVRFDSTLVFSKGAGVGKVWTSNANGTGSWQTFSSAGVTQGALDDSISAVRAIRKVDTIYKSLDSFIFKINGIGYSVLDSTGGGIIALQNDTLYLGSSGVYLPYIPLSGTVSGSPVTGDIAFTNSSNYGITSQDGSLYFKIFQDDNYNEISGRMIGLVDYTSTLPDLGYTQKIYVDSRISDTAAQIRSEMPDVSNLATITNLADTSSLLRGLINTKGTGTVTSVATDATLTGGTITTSGTLKVDTTVVSTKANVTGLLLAKANQSALNDSVTTLRNIRKQDTSYFALNATRDSLVYTKVINGTLYRTPVRDSTGGGGASLSGLTAATATNTINNANFGQEWQWNSLTSGTGLKLSSTSTGAANNLQNLLTVSQSGANATSGQTTYGAIFSNTHTGTSSTNIAAKFSASGATNNYAAIFENGNVGIGTTAPASRLDILGSGDFWGLNIRNSSVGALFQVSGGKAGFVGFNGSAYNNLDIRCGGSTQLFLSTNGNIGIADANPTQRLSLNGALYFSGTSTPSETVAIYAPNVYTLGFMTNNVERMRINDIGNVGIGTATPVASAILDLTSTTKGFKPPVMTATQASAIASPAKSLMLYVTDTNGTFTSAGLWIYTTSWKLIIAE